jgi:hypothetical protein
MRFIYSDTSIWNRLCDQNADPRSLSSALANNGLVPVLGFNVLYEMAKSFCTGTEQGTRRGRELFAYMRSYLALRVPIIKETGALLIEEACDVTGTARMESCFRSDAEYRTAIQEINKLCEGMAFEAEVAKSIENRKILARVSRSRMREHLETHPKEKAMLDRIQDDAHLSHFIKTQGVGRHGQLLLLGHLSAEFRQNSRDDLACVAALLLQSSRYRVSHVMVRTGLYLNWRCAQRGSIRSDLPDDTFHIVNAAYSDVFVTTEDDQADIARHAIEGIRTLVCEPDRLVSDQIIEALTG